MPDYSDQYPDYWTRLRNAEQPPSLQNASVGHRTARVRISRVRPKNVPLFTYLKTAYKPRFYVMHHCEVPEDFREGGWGRVKDEKG